MFLPKEHLQWEERCMEQFPNAVLKSSQHFVEHNQGTVPHYNDNDLNWILILTLAKIKIFLYLEWPKLDKKKIPLHYQSRSLEITWLCQDCFPNSLLATGKPLQFPEL